MQKLQVWQGALATMIGGVLSQALGLVAALVAILFVADLSALAEPARLKAITQSLPVVVPSTIAVGLTLATVALVTPLLAKVPMRDALGLQKAPWQAYLVAPIGVVSLGPLGDLLMTFMKRVAPHLTFGSVEMLTELVQSAPILLMLPVIALIPGFSEELLFRGVLQRSLPTGWPAVWIAGTVFAVFHLDPHHVVGVLPLGIYLSWVAFRTSTWVTITAHVANNAASVIALHVDSARVGYGTETPMPLWWVPVGLLVTAATVAVIHFAAGRKVAANNAPTQ